MPPESEEIEPENIGGGSSDPTGVISQTQTWTQDADGGYHYAMSGQVYGAIPQANIDLFTAAGAEFDTGTGYFKLNGLTNISYEEMLLIYQVTYPFSSGLISPGGETYGSTTIRTNIRPRYAHFWQFSSGANFLRNFVGNSYSNLSVVYIASDDNKKVSGSNWSQCFGTNRGLKGVYGIIDVSNISAAGNLANIFQNCYSLETTKIMGLKVDLNIGQSARLSMSSIEYMITNAGTANITITLHPTAYAAAQSDAGVQAALTAKTNVSLASA